MEADSSKSGEQPKKKRGRPRKKRRYQPVATVEPDRITPCIGCRGTDFEVLRNVEQSLGDGKSVKYRYRRCINCLQVQRQPIV